MLVLSREAKEAIKIGDAITVRVLGVKGNTVKLGIEAPRYVTVQREEIYLKTPASEVNRECCNA